MSINLESLVEKTVTMMGYELVDFEFHNQGRLIRIYIDKPASVTIDDCVNVSNHLNHVLSVEDEVDYDRLEVSSPGIDRVIKKLEDFVRFVGENIKLKTRMPIDERRNFKGKILGVEGSTIFLHTEDEGEIKIAFSEIDKAIIDPIL